MAYREKLASIIGDSVRIGLATASRVLLKNNAGVFEARNNADAAYIVGRGADPVGANDWVTLQYLTANSANYQVIQYTITAAGGATQDSVTSIPAGAVVFETREEVTIAWSPGTTIDVGDTATPALLIATADVDNLSTDIYAFPGNTPWVGASVVRATIGGAPGAGASVITVFYATPKP
jgi:hypothetical protein